MKKYDFDDIMYIKGSFCNTCKIEQPARSKHCKVCNVCVEKFDHHYIWFNQCVGVNNYRWFILFLFLHTIMCLYGFIIGILIYKSDLDITRQRTTTIFKDIETGANIEPNEALWFYFFFCRNERLLGLVIIMNALVANFLGRFLFINLNSARKNQTRNEAHIISACYRRLIRQKEMNQYFYDVTEDWAITFPDLDENKLFGLKIDGEKIPTTRAARLSKLK